MATSRASSAKKAARKPGAAKGATRKPARGKPAARGLTARAATEAGRLAGVGTDAVAKATGKTWDQWLALLDAAQAKAMPHKEIARMLADRFGVGPWWSQMVTVGYEQARGLRQARQKADGFSAGASRTVRAGLEGLYGAWADPALRTRWLGKTPVTIRRATDGKSMRITWGAGPSRVNVNFYAVGADRSRVQVEHGKLGDAGEASEKKAFWSGALDRLKALLEREA